MKKHCIVHTYKLHDIGNNITKANTNKCILCKSWLYVICLVILVLLFIIKLIGPVQKDLQLTHSDRLGNNLQESSASIVSSEQQVDHGISSNLVISCYYNMPNPNELHHYQLMPHDIHPFLCTHINVAFATIINKKIILNNYQYDAVRNVTKLKSINPNLKILLSVGGAGQYSGFSEMVANHYSRKLFIKSIKNILQNLTLDGIDLDWEYPGVQISNDKFSKRERQHFSQLLREIRMEYIREKHNYLLTVAVAAPQTIVDVAYDVEQVNMYCDYVNVMTYDLHSYSKLTPLTGLNSPLYARISEKLFMATLNINYTVHMYIDKGLDTNKIVVGIPTYGHSFTLVNPSNFHIGSPASGYGSLGGLGFVNYPDLCQFMKQYNNSVIVKQEEAAKVPYLFRNKEWVSYDNCQSVMDKAEYIKVHKLRGAMVYSLNADDYRGVCQTQVGVGYNFPLVWSVNKVLLNNVI